MAIVGEAVVRVRIISDRMGAEIRDAVKKGLADADSDIDNAGQDTGKKLSNSVSKGVRANREKLAKDIGSEIVLSSRRFVADSEGAIDDAGNRLGNRLITGIGDGINDQRARERIGHNLLSAFQGGTDSLGLDRSGRTIGDRFMQGIASGLRSSEPTLARARDGSLARALAPGNSGGSNSALAVIGRDIGDNFTRAIGSGIRGGNGEDFFHNEFRRVFAMGDGSVIDGDSEVIGERIMGGVNRGVRRSVPDTARAFRDSATNARQQFLGSLGLHDSAFRQIGREWSQFSTRGFADGKKAFSDEARKIGEEAGKAGGDGVRNGVNSRRGRLRADFGDLGKDLGQHFNLGIGAARMGPAIISILTTAGPSILAGAGAIITSLAAEIVTAIAAIGPGIVGGLALGGAAIATLGLNLGLLKLAFSGTGAQAKAFKAEFADFKSKLTEAFAPGVLTGFSDMIKNLSKNLLPGINTELAATGVAMGNIARRIGETVSSSANLGRIQGILRTNTTFLDNFGQGLSGLTTSFLILFNAAKPFVDFLGQSIKRFGDWASASLAVSEANGNLASWMDRMLASFRDLMGIVRNFGSGFANIFKAAAPAGKTMLDSIRDIAQRFSDWTSNSTGMDKMTAFFTKAHILASKVWEVLGAIFTAGGRAFEGMDLGPILHVLDVLETRIAPAIARFFNQIQAGASDNLVKAFDNIGTALTKIADSGNFERVANLMGTILEKISEFAASDFGSTVLSFVLPFAIMGGLLTSLVGPLAAVGKGLFSLIGYFAGGEGAIAGFAAAAAPIAAIAAVIAGAFVLITVNSQNFRDALSAMATGIGEAFSGVWDKIGPKIQVVWEKLQLLASVIGDRLAPVIEFLIPVVQRAIQFIGDIFSNIFDAIGGFIDLLTGILTGDWGKVWQGITEIVSAAWQQIVTIFGGAISLISFAWDAITAVVYNAGQVIYKFLLSIWTGISSVASSVWDGISSFLSGVWNSIWDTAVSIWNSITDFFSGVWDNVSSAAETVWNNITNFFSTTWDGIKNQATSTWTQITDFFSGIWDGVSTAVETAWNGITTFLSQVWDGIVQGLAKVFKTLFDISMIPLKALVALFSLIWDQIKAGIFLFWDTTVGILSGIWGHISDVAVTIWTGITDFFSGIWNGISNVATTVWTAVSSYLSTTWDQIRGRIDEAWTGITDFFGGIWNGISEVATTVWTAVSSYLSTTWDQIRGRIDEAWTAIVDFFTGIWNAITIGVTTAWTFITGILGTIWQGIVDLTNTVWNGVVAFFQFIWDTISNAISTAWNAVSSYLSTTWDQMRGRINEAWNAISNFFGTVWDTITNIFHTVVDAVASWLSQRWQDISNTASTIWNGIVGIASTIWNGIVDAIEGVVGPIVGWLQQRWDDISTAVSTAWSDLEGIVSGVWEGIKRVIIAPIEEAYYDLVGWVKDIEKLISGAWDTVSGIFTNISNAVKGSADKIAEAAALPGAAVNSPFAPPTATGGVFRPTPGGQLRTIAEAGKAERVEPLDPNGLSVRDLAWLDQVMAAQGTGDTVVHVYIGQQELTNLVNTQVEKSNSTLARDARSRRV